MTDIPDDIFTEPDDIDMDTLANLGPLTGMAGIWEGLRGTDVSPDASGAATTQFLERISLQPIDPQPNGPQLLYGLRYETHITKVGEIATFHGQVGYWLWEPATQMVIHTLTIPRAQVAIAGGYAAPDARQFTLHAERGSTGFGICSSPFLEAAFRTESFTISVTINDDGSWSYDEDTVMIVKGRSEPFHHRDRNTLTLIAPPTPNPSAPPRD